MNSQEVAATTTSMSQQSKVINDLKTKSAAVMNKGTYFPFSECYGYSILTHTTKIHGCIL